MNPEISAMDAGRQRSRVALSPLVSPLSGQLPNAANPRGGPAAVDKYSMDFQRAIAILKDLSDKLNKEQSPVRPKDGVEIAEMATELQHMAIDRQDEMIKQAQEVVGKAQFPNINAMGAGSLS